MKKGNVLIGQSGGPTSVINSSLCGITQSALDSNEFTTIYGMRFGIEGFIEEKLINLNNESSENIERLRRTPGSALGSCRYKLQDEDLPKVRTLLEKYGIKYLFLIGGNDTMDTIHRVEKYCREARYDLSGIGVPKTVDNDLYGTDHSPGFASAAYYIALSVQQAGRLAADMQRVDRYTVFQTIGRDSGWLAASSALAKRHAGDAPHLIYMPERRLKKEKVIKDVEHTIHQYGWCYIVIGEGALWEDGTPVSQSQTEDKFANVEFGAMGGSSAAMNLHRMIHSKFGYRGEFQITESLPMCAIDRVSMIDVDEAYTCGAKAVEFAREGRTGIMVSMKRRSNTPYTIEYTTTPLQSVAVRAKPIPNDYINEEGNFVNQKFIEYVRPLIQDFPEYSTLGE